MQQTRFRVSGGMGGSSDSDMNGRGSLAGFFIEEFEDKERAIERARELAIRLRPGGSVLVREFMPGPTQATQLPDSFVGLTRRNPDGSYWSKREGVDFQPEPTVRDAGKVGQATARE